MTHLFTLQNTGKFERVASEWLGRCQKMINEYYKERRMETTTLAFMPKGRKYLKVMTLGSNQHVWAFVEKATGNILKPATWAAPAKHARGNIFDASGGMARMTAYGPEYLK